MDEVRQLEQAVSTAITCMNQVEAMASAAVFVGNTKSGKSSLINYLIGNKLVGIKIDSYRPVAISKADDAPGPKIGLGYTSETIIPTMWLSPKLPSLQIWDVPGFDDNRGAVQDIVNSFYINGLFKRVISAKIIVVLDISDLTNDNIRPLLNVLKAVEKLLGEKMRDHVASVAVIITKVPDVLNETKIDKNVICEILQNQLLSTSEIDISEPVCNLVQHLITNHQNIGFFRRPDVGEIIDAAVDDGIVSAITNARCIDNNVLKQISPSVSASSKVFLHEIREKMTYKQAFLDLENTICSVVNGKMGHFESMQHDGIPRHQLVNLEHELKTFKGKVSQCQVTTDFGSKIEFCKEIDSALKNFVDQRKLKEMTTFILFTDYILNASDGAMLMGYMQNALNSAMTRIDILLNWIPMQLGVIATREAEEVAARERARQEEEMRQLQARIEAERIVEAQRLAELSKPVEVSHKKKRWWKKL